MAVTFRAHGIDGTGAQSEIWIHFFHKLDKSQWLISARSPKTWVVIRSFFRLTISIRWSESLLFASPTNSASLRQHRRLVSHRKKLNGGDQKKKIALRGDQGEGGKWYCRKYSRYGQLGRWGTNSTITPKLQQSCEKTNHTLT